jgi:hypothetical protein
LEAPGQLLARDLELQRLLLNDSAVGAIAGQR